MKLGIWPALALTALLATQIFAQKLAWTWSNPQPHGNDIVDMAWNGTLGVQVCELGRVYTSPNLIDWYPQNSNLTNDLQAVTFLGRRIIVTGANGAITYSDDGVNFTNCSVSTTNWLVSVAASSSQAVAVGDNGALYTSADGATWHLQSQPPYLAPSWLTSVAYGNGVFVATGDSGGVSGGSYIANSSDGVNWVNQTPGTLFMSNLGNLEHVTWVNSSGSITNFPYTGFWAVDDAGHVIYSTNNGVAWKKLIVPNSTNVLYTLAADNTTCLLAGDTEVRLGSFVSNVMIWPPQIGSGLAAARSWTYFAAVRDTNGVYELAGYDGLIEQSSTSYSQVSYTNQVYTTNIYYATNGNYFWTDPYNSPRDWLWQAALANGLYVAVGDNARIMTSANGADWTVEAVQLTNSVSSTNTVFFCIGGTTNLLVAAGTGGSLAISPNFVYPVVQTNTDGSLFTNNVSSLGLSWYSKPAPAGTTNDLAGVCTFSNKFYLVGGNGTLLNSPDGTNWTRLTSGTSNYLSGIAAHTNGLLVLTGNEGTILTSPNGTNWTSRTAGTTNWLYRVRCLNGKLLTVGENGALLTSPNGTNWASLASGVTNWLNDAVMVSNTCYVVGNQGVVLASTNFITWTNLGTITTRSLDGVVTQNGQLVAVGFQGTIVRSQVVPVTTPVNFTEFAQSAGYNLFSVHGTVDQHFTLDSSTNLVNWVTGPLQDLIYGDGTLIFYQSLSTNPPPAQFYRCTVTP